MYCWIAAADWAGGSVRITGRPPVHYCVATCSNLDWEGSPLNGALYCFPPESTEISCWAIKLVYLQLRWCCSISWRTTGWFLGMLIALPVAAVIVVLLKHARDNYEKSRLYGLPIEVSVPCGEIQHINVDAGDVELDIEIKNSQDTGTSNSNDFK